MIWIKDKWFNEIGQIYIIFLFNIPIVPKKQDENNYGQLFSKIISI